MPEDQLFPDEPAPEREPEQGYYITIPAALAEDRRILDKAKMLYGVIASYTRISGKCAASSRTLAEKLQTTPRTIRFCLAQLETAGYIRRTVNREAAQIKQPQREIRLSWDWTRGVEENFLPVGRKKPTGAEENFRQGVKKNSNIPPLVPQGERATCFSFSEFWEMYGKKIGRAACERKYAKIGEADREQIKKTLPRFIESTPLIQFRPHPQTYLNGRRWEDELPARRSAEPMTEEQINAEIMKR